MCPYGSVKGVQRGWRGVIRGALRGFGGVPKEVEEKLLPGV